MAKNFAAYAPESARFKRESLGQAPLDGLDQYDVCGVCLASLAHACEHQHDANDSCILVRGTCSHSFHQCCVLKWFRDRVWSKEGITCPVCKQAFVYRELQCGAEAGHRNVHVFAPEFASARLTEDLPVQLDGFFTSHGHATDHLQLKVPLDATVSCVIEHPELAKFWVSGSRVHILAMPGRTFWPGDPSATAERATRVIALCSASAQQHSEEVMVRAEIEEGEAEERRTLRAVESVVARSAIDDMLIAVGRRVNVNPTELSIQLQSEDDGHAKVVADLLAYAGRHGKLERDECDNLVLPLSIRVSKATQVHLDFYTQHGRLSPSTRLTRIPQGTELFASFRRMEHSRIAQVQHQGVQSLFGACAAWQPFECAQTRDGMSIFLSTLFALSGPKGLERKKRLEMLGHFRSISQFPPAAWALHLLLSQATSQFTDSDKSVISNAVYSIMRQQAPQHIPNNKLFEHSRVFFAFLIGSRLEADAITEKFVIILSSHFANGMTQGAAELTAGDQDDEEDGEEVADEDMNGHGADEGQGLSQEAKLEHAALYSQSFPFADEFFLWFGTTPARRCFLHPWDDLVDALADCRDVQLLKPLALQASQPVQITRDVDGTAVAYVGMPGSGAGQVALFCPLQHSEVERDIQELARKVAAMGFTDMSEGVGKAKAEVKEAVVVCVDCSQSMAGSSGFLMSTSRGAGADGQEDLGVQLIRERHLRGFDERPPNPDTPEALERAVANFASGESVSDLCQITHSMTTGGSSSAFHVAGMQVLAEWCRLQSMLDVLDDNNEIRLISKYPGRFIEVLASEVTSRSNNQTGIPDALMCPITYSLLEDPVLAVDGFTYERSAIEMWLRSSSISPMTRQPMGSPVSLIPNMAVRAMAREWREAAQTPIADSFPIFVRGLPGDAQTATFYVSASTTVAALLHRIDSKMGLNGSANFSRLKHRGSILRPAQTMHEAGIQRDNTVEFTMLMESWAQSNIGSPVLVQIWDRLKTGTALSIIMHDRDTIGSVLVRLWRYGKGSLRGWGLPSEIELWHGLEKSGDGWRRGTRLDRGARLMDYRWCFQAASQSASRPGLAFYRLDLELCKSQQASSSGPQPISRLDAVKACFTGFTGRLAAYQFPVELGLVTFASQVNMSSSISPLFAEFGRSLDHVKAEGDTALYQAISSALDMLEEWRSQKGNPSLALRVICLSDGQDTDSSILPQSVANHLRRIGAVLDAVHIGSNPMDMNLKRLAKASGGYIFKPRSIHDALRLNELEPFLHVLERPLTKRPSPKPRIGNLQFLSLGHEAVDVCTEGTVPARVQPPELRRPAVPLESAVAVLQSGSQPATASPQRVRRLAREMRRLMQEAHVAYDVYPGAGADALSCWRVVMDGPAESPYAGGCWLLYVLFPPGYPNQAPEVRFITQIRHCNVNAHGRVCHSILDRNWSPDTNMVTVMNCVYGLLMQPDKHDPVDTSLSLEYHAGGAYEVAIQEHVRLHCKLTRQQWRQKIADGEPMNAELEAAMRGESEAASGAGAPTSDEEYQEDGESEAAEECEEEEDIFFSDQEVQSDDDDDGDDGDSGMW
eukprot:TRINITY_DN1598_c0_g3_i1.p1 TRINITY_DN1598_c0_g3~~TRINITY_DN1598_c0_g3_i1.p1  ORF type:complete len:1717 (-),score=297.72 TRINITY_DN1598_c0_g3_i1:314-4999(-)